MMTKVVFLLLMLTSLGAAAQTTSLRAIWLNHQAIGLLKDSKPEEALNKWAEALSTSPESAEIHLNMGLAFEALGQQEKAIQSFQNADRLAESQEVQFLARFNQGALHQKNKKVDEALLAYHAALDVVPSSKETKINIELLIQQQQQDQKDQKGKSGEGEPKPQDGKGQGKDNKDSDQKDKKDDKPGDKKKEEQPKQYAKNKPQPKPFNSKDMDPSQAKKILGEILNQEQRIRAEYNKREVKERPRDKDW